MRLSNISICALLIASAVGHPLEPRTGSKSPQTHGSSSKSKVVHKTTPGSSPKPKDKDETTPGSSPKPKDKDETTPGSSPKPKKDDDDEEKDAKQPWDKTRWRKVVINDRWYDTPSDCSDNFNVGEEAPPKGCTGAWWDAEKKQVNAMYGNRAYLHASHVSYHYHWSEHVYHPAADRQDHNIAWPLDSKDHKDKVTRPESLKGLSGKFDKPLVFKPVRDEKMPATFQHDKLVTVAWLPDFESIVEGALIKAATQICVKQYKTREAATGKCKIKLWDWRSIDNGKYEQIPRLLAKHGNTDPNADNPAKVEKGDTTPRPELESTPSSDSLDHTKTGKADKPKDDQDGKRKKPKPAASSSKDPEGSGRKSPKPASKSPKDPQGSGRKSPKPASKSPKDPQGNGRKSPKPAQGSGRKSPKPARK